MPKRGRTATERRQLAEALARARRRKPVADLPEATSPPRVPDPAVTRVCVIALSLLIALIVATKFVGWIFFAAPFSDSLGFAIFPVVIVVSVIVRIIGGKIRSNKWPGNVYRCEQPIEYWTTLAMHLVLVAVIEGAYINTHFIQRVGQQ